MLQALRGAGLDLLEEFQRELRPSLRAPEPLVQRLAPEVVAAVTAERTRAETAKTTTDRRTTMATPQDVPRNPFEARRELAELRETVRKQEASILEMLAQADNRIRALETEVAQLRDAERSGMLRGPSTSELVRRVAWQWFTQHPGQKTTPQILEMNIADDLPEGYGKSMVAGGCRDLLKLGRIQGGGARAGDAPTRGIYWYDPGMDAKPGHDV